MTAKKSPKAAQPAQYTISNCTFQAIVPPTNEHTAACLTALAKASEAHGNALTALAKALEGGGASFGTGITINAAPEES